MKNNKFRWIHLPFGKVVYIRHNNTIVAAKIESLLIDGGYVYFEAITPTGEKVHLLGNSHKLSIYETIENAIKNKPMETFLISAFDVICEYIDESDFPVCEVSDFVSITTPVILVTPRWKWNSYEAISVNVPLSYYTIKVTENGISSVPRHTSNCKYYMTEDECRADNFVKVISF